MTQTPGPTIREYLEILRRRRIFLVVVALAVTIVGSAPALLESPVYAASADIVVGASRGAPEDLEDRAQSRARELATVVEVLQSREMRDLARERLGPNMDRVGSVEASLRGFTDVVRVRVSASSPEAAAEAANALAEAFVEQRRQEAADALAGQDDEPGVEDVTRVVSSATPHSDPVSPQRRQAVAIALALGVVVAVGAAALLEILQDRVASVDALDALDPRVSVLASIPHVGAALDGPDTPLPAPATEAFRYLRTALGFRSKQIPSRAFVVTSATSGEGKTTTAIHLARAAADAGATVVLIDADLRRPAVHERMGLANDRGLTSVLLGDSTFGDAVQHATASLSVLTAGDPEAVSNEVLGGEQFARLVQDVTQHADWVIIDVPPVLPVADALLAAQAADATVLVARLGAVSRRDVRAAIRRFHDAPLPLAGLVANDDPRPDHYGRYTTLRTGSR